MTEEQERFEKWILNGVPMATTSLDNSPVAGSDDLVTTSGPAPSGVSTNNPKDSK